MSGAWRALYPFEPRRLDLGDYSMSYLDEGEGELVLMVHGNPTWSFYFRELVKALRGERRCLVPDHVGMGLSDKPGEDEYRYTLESRIKDLETLVERVAPEGPVTLVVHDWGGMIGMGWAVRHPERVKAIVAFNTACFALPGPKTLRLLRSPLGGALLRGSAALRRMVLRSCTARPLPPAVAEAYTSVCDGWRASLAVQRFVKDIPLAPGDPAWDAVAAVERGVAALAHVPVLLPWGMKDWVFDRAFLDGWKRRFPKAKAVPFEDAGHFPLEDDPGRFVPLVRDFVLGPVRA